MVTMLVTTILISVFVVTSYAEYNQNDNHKQRCDDFNYQHWVAVDKLLGKWFAVEVIFHDKEESEIINDNVCPIIFLQEISQDRLISGNPYSDNIHYRDDFQPNIQTNEENVDWDELIKPVMKTWKEVSNGKQYKSDRRRTYSTTTNSPSEELESFKRQILKRLRLVWNEDGKNMKYYLHYNESSPGYWMSFGSQNDSMYDQHEYTQFTGTIQILKAVHKHTVLTFCHVSQKHQFFSVVISREPYVDQTDLEHIHHMLERKNLLVRQRRRTCRQYENSSNGLLSDIKLAILLIFIVLFSYRVTNS